MTTNNANQTTTTSPHPSRHPPPSSDKSGRVGRKKRWPRGITLARRQDRGGKWQVNWVERVEGKRLRKAKLFESKEAAACFADELAAKVEEHGVRILSFDPRKWERFVELEAALDGADFSEVIDVWREHLIRRRRRNILTGDAVREFLEILTLEGISTDHMRHVRKHLERLVDFVGEATPLLDVSSGNIRDWLNMLADGGADDEAEGAGFAPLTIRHHLKDVRAFFVRARAEHWIEESPADKSRVKGPKVKAGEKLALSIAEAKKLFEANREHRVVGCLALEAFAGVRYTGAVRLRREHVNWEDRLIVLPADQHKSESRHVLDGLPENVWAWLRHADKLEKFWEMTQRQYLDEKAEAFARAGVENPGNILRRSFCSWNIARLGDANQVAVWMQHRSPEMLYRQYKTSRTRTGFVTKKEAPAWTKIVP